MNNGYQKSNGCGADKEGGKIFNTFFYPELQSKHIRPLATNVLQLYAVVCRLCAVGKLRIGGVSSSTAINHKCLIEELNLFLFFFERWQK
jgi:hypothetical protein